MAKKFFYVCVGLFFLALSYHVGAQRAGAQSGGAMEGANISPGPYGQAASFVVNRVLYTSQQTTAGYWYPVPAAPVTGVPIPGTATIVTTSPTAVLLANGEVYTASYGYGGNLIGASPVPVRSNTFGALKAKYR